MGLGDRHLGNLLVVEGSGAVVPIDFGYSFGTAVLVSQQFVCMELVGTCWIGLLEWFLAGY